ncbi:MAG: A24 family peptidase C-terminal domain-containing protein, partial [Candidatus Bathyarchaeia archaeon]
NRKLVLLPDIRDDEAAEEVFRRLGGEGVEEVWVSHTLPFLVFITIGYVLTLLFGDIALSVLSWLLFQ